MNPFKGFISIAYLSHKVLRWFAGLFLAGIFSFNLFVINIPTYRIIFIIQIFSYLLAFARIRFKPIILIHYFLFMNLATLIGFFKFVFGKQEVTWKKTN